MSLSAKQKENIMNLYTASPATWAKVAQRRPATLIPTIVHVNSGGWVYYENTEPVWEDPTAKPIDAYQATELVKHEALRGNSFLTPRIVDHVNCEELRGWFLRQVETRQMTREFVLAFPIEMAKIG